MNNIGKDTRDRALGEYWEDRFCELARQFGWRAWPFQRMRGATFEFNGARYICPDVWVLRRETQQYICEIKHKNLSCMGEYGFEQYRQESMLGLERAYHNQFGGVQALYVVHDYDLAGGKFVETNVLEHWCAQRLQHLAEHARLSQSQTLYAGHVTANRVPIFYYKRSLFSALKTFLA